MKTSHRLSSINSIILILLFIVTSFHSFGQGCNCPPIKTCGTCVGGLTNLSLRFNGSTASSILASYQSGVIFSGVLNPGETFTVNFTGVTVGSSIELRVDGVVDAFIGNVCGSGVAIGNNFGRFSITAGQSKDGGALCCGPSFLEVTPPAISNCPVSIVMSLPAASCSTVVNWTPPIATDNCQLESLTSTHLPGATFPSGTTTVIYTALDVYGNSSTCSFNVTVNDITKPIIAACPANIVASAGPSCNAVVSWTAPSASDNCSVTITSDHKPGDLFPIGTTLVTYTATDPSGNKATCSFNVVVTDAVSPVFTRCPTDVILRATNSCEAVATWGVPSATDNCSVSVTSSHNSGGMFPIGSTTVTYTATDPQGNKATCSFNVMVTNPGSPSITKCPDQIVVSADESEVAMVSWAEPQATVLCGEVTVTKSHEPGSIFSVGTTVVTYTFTDDGGNASTCEFNVLVLEPDVVIDISKIITPDGDGINDIWILTNIEKYQNNKVVVVDRWGNMVFTGVGYNNESVAWDATRENGTRVPTGTYFYTVELQSQNSIIKQKGYLEVIQ